MNIFNLFNKEDEILSNGKIQDKRSVNDPTKKFVGSRYVKVKRQASTTRKDTEFVKPEYDLPTIANAVQMDGYLRRSINLFKEQILKNGFEFTSTNDDIVTHVNRRIKEIEKLTGISFEETITAITEQLVTYGNAYLVKVRSGNKSSLGDPYKLYGKTLNPIVGLFTAEATTIEIGLDKTGNISQYKQLSKNHNTTNYNYHYNYHSFNYGDQYSNYWNEYDIIHFAYNKIPGTLTGQSSIIPVLDDLRALRKLEEEIEILAFQYAIPLYLYKVGNKDIPPAPGEIDDTANKVNSMPAYGMLVVPGHHSIEVPTNTSTPVDVMQFVNHFKMRIFSGLGVSPIAMGEVSTSNRNTSEVADLTMQSITKSYQQIIKYKIEMELIRELLLDGGFKSIDDNLDFNFPEIDLENQIKYETNIIQKWQNNLISREEARLELDYDKKINNNDTFLEVVDIPKIEAEIQGSILITKSKPDGSSSVKKENANKSRPTNQHGTSSGRPKIKKDYVTLDDSFKSLYNNLLDEDGYLSKMNINTFSKKMVSNFKTSIRLQFNDIYYSYCKYYNVESKFDQNMFDDYLSDSCLILDDKIKRYSKDLSDDIRKSIFVDTINNFFDIQKEKVKNLAKIMMYKSLGYNTILLSDDCDNHLKRNIDINTINYANLPPFGKDCKCFVEEDSLHEFK